METFSALLTICAGNSPATGGFPAHRPVTRSFDVFFDLRLNKLLSKQSWGWWFETLLNPFRRHCNDKIWVCKGYKSCVKIKCCILKMVNTAKWGNRYGTVLVWQQHPILKITHAPIFLYLAARVWGIFVVQRHKPSGFCVKTAINLQWKRLGIPGYKYNETTYPQIWRE